jgi:hypothetical protein
VTSEAKLFAIVFQGNSRAAFLGSKIASRLIRIASRANRTALRANVSEASKFPVHQNGTA